MFTIIIIIIMAGWHFLLQDITQQAAAAIMKGGNIAAPQVAVSVSYISLSLISVDYLWMETAGENPTCCLLITT